MRGLCPVRQRFDRLILQAMSRENAGTRRRSVPLAAEDLSSLTVLPRRVSHHAMSGQGVGMERCKQSTGQSGWIFTNWIYGDVETLGGIPTRLSLGTVPG